MGKNLNDFGVSALDLGKTPQVHTTRLLSPTIYAELENGIMGLRDLLRLPKIHLRKRGKARSEIENPTGVGLSVLHPTESTLDPQIGASSSPPTPQGQESNGMWAVLAQNVHLITFSSDRPSDSYGHPSALNETEGTDAGSSNPVAGPSATGDNRSNIKSLVYSGAKLILNGVKESADAFGPLKSVAGGLCFILDTFEVRHSPASAVHNAYTVNSK